MHNVTAAQAAFLSKFTAIRAATFGLGGTIGVDFTREAAAEWKARGFDGLASALYNLSQATIHVVGSWDVHVKARDLAAAIAADQNRMDQERVAA